MGFSPWGIALFQDIVTTLQQRNPEVRGLDNHNEILIKDFVFQMGKNCHLQFAQTIGVWPSCSYPWKIHLIHYRWHTRMLSSPGFRCHLLLYSPPGLTFVFLCCCCVLSVVACLSLCLHSPHQNSEIKWSCIHAINNYSGMSLITNEPQKSGHINQVCFFR